ncbi:MAG: xylulokinase [Anaerolineae bacterium]|nr:xylulokinase [Anaerolineae bacterium]
MTPNYLLGIDVSTTGSKLLLVDASGLVVAVVTQPHSIATPRPLWSEQDPGEWWQAVRTGIRQALKQAGISGSQVIGVGLTGQMHGLTLLDKRGQVLRPAILWNDQRTGAECDQIRERVGARRLIEITGNDALTGFTAPKILWVRSHEPEIYRKICHILLPKDYIRYRLTGEFATDCADAAGTILLNLKERIWSDEILRALEIPRTWLPTVYEGTQITGRISRQAAEETGLAAGTPVVGGGGDQAAQAVGVGAVQPGVVALTLGTSGVVFATVAQPFIEPQGRLHAFCHAVPGRWHLMGVMLSAAGSLRWYRDTFSPGQSFEELLQPAERIPPGSEGLLFLPYLTGERTPYPDPMARGAFVGLTVRHTKAHCSRSVLEGVAFGLRDGFELIRSAGLDTVQQVRVSGGGSKSRLWQQILADVLATELVTVNTTEGAAFGAAMLAGVGAGMWPDVDAACTEMICLTGSVAPDPASVRLYEPYYNLYRRLYPSLADIQHELNF